MFQALICSNLKIRQRSALAARPIIALSFIHSFSTAAIIKCKLRSILLAPQPKYQEL